MYTYVHYRGGHGYGAVGHDGGVLRYMNYNRYVPVKVDSDTGDIWRDPKTGFAMRMQYEEGGEILVKLPSEQAWSGYWQAKEDTEKKLLRNIFQKGDVYFRTGDVLYRNSDGFWYFRDRLGKQNLQLLIHASHSA
jgi:acyl-CoA synthetase (AMP-forming)/AMP-acid ligase II